MRAFATAQGNTHSEAGEEKLCILEVLSRDVASDANTVTDSTPEQLRAIDAGGHFYLGGLTEVGSELLLHPDGRFEWALMYGALNQTAAGQWHRDGHHVVLEAAVDEPEVPTRLDTFLPWSEAAERQLSQYQHGQARQAVIERCPFVESVAYTSSVAMAGVEQPSAKELTDRAVQSARRLKTAVAEMEAEARVFVKADVDQRQASAVTAALDEYHSALAAAKDAHWAAGVDLELRQPEFPAECQLPPSPDHQNFDDPTSWQGGVAVRVGDVDSKLFFSNFAVALKFSDGTTEHGVTDRGGWVVRPRGSTRLSGIEVAFPEGVDAPVFQLNVPSDQAGAIAMVDVDLSLLTQPAFETMRLRIDGDGLIPTWPSGQARGRYYK